MKQRFGRPYLHQRARHHALETLHKRRPIDRNFWGRHCEGCGTVRPTSNAWGVICGCEEREASQLMVTYVTEHRAGTIAEIRGASGVPRRFERCSFAGFEHRPGTEAVTEAVRSWVNGFSLDTRSGFLLAGSPGSGKTHLSVAALNAVVEATLVHARFISAGDLVASVRGGEGRRLVDYEPVERAIEAELLVLDDVGQEVGSDFARDIVARLIMGRYDQARPTLFTSNRGPHGMEAALGDAVLSRILEMGSTHRLVASDYRQGPERVIS